MSICLEEKEEGQMSLPKHARCRELSPDPLSHHHRILLQCGRRTREGSNRLREERAVLRGDKRDPEQVLFPDRSALRGCCLRGLEGAAEEARHAAHLGEHLSLKLPGIRACLRLARLRLVVTKGALPNVMGMELANQLFLSPLLAVYPALQPDCGPGLSGCSQHPWV